MEKLKLNKINVTRLTDLESKVIQGGGTTDGSAIPSYNRVCNDNDEGGPMH